MMNQNIMEKNDIKFPKQSMIFFKKLFKNSSKKSKFIF